MEPEFNIDRPRISDEEINKHKNFDQLIKQFKQQSLRKAQLDKSWWKSKKVRYSAVIAGITVICTVSYLTLFNNQTNKNKSNETLITQNTGPEIKNQELPPRKSFVNAPSSKIAIPYSSYKVDNSKGGEIKHTSSSKIKIPKNSFVDKNGKDVIGDVTIEYREFHDKGDIIAGGIPMAYDSAGKKYSLESAGMFDIKGNQNGEPVFIKPNKDLQVELASANDEDRFNQYYLDTIEKNWKYIKKDHPVKPKDLAQKPKEHSSNTNSKIETLKNDVEVVLPKKIDSVKVVYTKKVEALPKAKEPNKPSKPSGKQTFNIDASPDDFPELASFNNLLFEIGDENKNYTKEMNTITWSDVKISEGPQKGKNYLLTLSYRNRVEKLIVYPVLTGTDFEKAQKRYEQKFSEYQGLVEKKEANEKRLLAEMEAKQKAYMLEMEKKKAEYEKERSLMLAKMQSQETNELANGFNKMSNQVKASRIFSVSRFGIYNSDCANPYPSGKTVSPVFALEGKNNTISPDFIYLVDHSKNMVFNLNSARQILYNPNSINSFVIFSKNKMYLCNKNTFKENSENDSKHFTVTELPESADNLVDFKKALEI